MESWRRFPQFLSGWRQSFWLRCWPVGYNNRHYSLEQWIECCTRLIIYLIECKARQCLIDLLIRKNQPWQREHKKLGIAKVSLHLHDSLLSREMLTPNLHYVDHGEPHDLPNPFSDPKAQKSLENPSNSSTPAGQMSRNKARQSIEAAQRNAQQARQRRKEENMEAKRDAKMDEMRSVLERLRDARQQEQQH